MSALLEIEGLCVSYRNDVGEESVAVRDASLTLGRGEALGVVGESGSGKSTLAMAVPRLLPLPAAKVEAKRISLDGVDLLSASPDQLRDIRGRRIGVIFQEPMTSLSPLHRIGGQIEEAVAVHSRLSRARLREVAIDWLGRVGIRDPESAYRAWPHEFSGGMQQRVMIAMALVNDPDLVIADEPTTALDATTQAQVLGLMKRLIGKNAGLLLITHDMGVVSGMADRVAVMHDGVIVETAPCHDIFNAPKHPYTRKLIGSIPCGTAAVRDNAQGCVLDVEGVSVKFGDFKAVDNVSLSLREGETLAVVGESGSGKTTLSRAILGLVPMAAGRVVFDGRDVSTFRSAERKAYRRAVQVVFQDPFASLNPRHTILDIVTEGMLAHGLATRRDRREKAAALLGDVGLDGSILDRYPHEFSGGQRQRVAIARALSLNPRVLICDEAVSALDLSIRAQILELLAELKRKRCLSYLFITHDFGVVRSIADRVVVMCHGRIVEEGVASDVLSSPREEYTKGLLAAVNAYSPRIGGA